MYFEESEDPCLAVITPRGTGFLDNVSKVFFYCKFSRSIISPYHKKTLYFFPHFFLTLFTIEFFSLH